MTSARITAITAEDRRFDLEGGARTDAVHSGAIYAYAVCRLHTDADIDGAGMVLTLGPGNELVCRAIEGLADQLVGREIHELMADFGPVWAAISDSPAYRWIGPHKGVVHLALASITNACFDLWAKAEGVPLWKLLTDLSPDQVTALLDFRYVEDVLTKDEALAMLSAAAQTRAERESIITQGFPGYDTSVGWFNYPDDQIVENAKRAIDKGFRAMKLKVGSKDATRDIRRVGLIRETVGADTTLMIDVNQQWTVQQAIDVTTRLWDADIYWVEEPTDPDDVIGHQTIARAVHPTRIATGEHVANKVLFKNYLQAQAMAFNQVDALRVGGVSEFILVSLMSAKFGVPVIPHVGDMGQLHQHMVPFNHLAIGLPALFLEHIPHLRKHFRYPVSIEDGRYHLPQEPGSTMDFVD